MRPAAVSAGVQQAFPSAKKCGTTPIRGNYAVISATGALPALHTAQIRSGVIVVNRAILTVGLQDAVLVPLVQILRSDGYSVVSSLEIDVAGWLTENRWFDLILLDIDLFPEEGRQLLNRLRRNGPISAILLRGIGRMRRKVPHGYDADICLTSDLMPEQIAAFTSALLRKDEECDCFEFPAGELPILQGDFFLDALNCWGVVGEKVVSFNREESLILHFFLEHPQQAIPYQTLRNLLWQSDHYGADEQTVVASLRKKIEGRDREAGYIREIEGFGYRFYDIPLQRGVPDKADDPGTENRGI